MRLPKDVIGLVRRCTSLHTSIRIGTSNIADESYSSLILHVATLDQIKSVMMRCHMFKQICNFQCEVV